LFCGDNNLVVVDGMIELKWYRWFPLLHLTCRERATPVVSTAGFGTQTDWISLSAPGAPTSTGGVRYLIGKSGHGLHVNRRTASIQLDRNRQG